MRSKWTVNISNKSKIPKIGQLQYALIFAVIQFKLAILDKHLRFSTTILTMNTLYTICLLALTFSASVDAFFGGKMSTKGKTATLSMASSYIQKLGK